MHAERDHLVTVVFPELRERVEQLGLEFFDVDLRWGVPEKTVNGETANSWEYCRQWIDRVEPFFVCILGQRYGWVPEPEQLKSQEDRQRQQDEKRSITDMEVRHAVLSTKLKRRSFFYFRETQLPELSSDMTDEQKKFHAEFVDPPELITKLETLKIEIKNCGRPVRNYTCCWTGKEFTDLDKAEKQFGPMVLEDLWSGVLRDERYISKDIWRQVLKKDPDTDPVYTDETNPVLAEIAKELVELAKPKPKNPLDAEREQMETFTTSRLRWFQGRTNELKQLNDFINSTDEKSPRFSALVAVPGQGKSALLAKLHEQLKSSPHFVITHFVGATERSASTYELIKRLLDELDRSGIAWPIDEKDKELEPKQDFNSLCLRLAQRLGDYAGERRIVILLDALNQLSDGHDLNWLPYRLGPSVRVILSCIEDPKAKEDSPESKVLRALDLRHSASLRVSLGPLTTDDVRTIVVVYLKEYCHELDSAHLDTLCAITQAHNPLYLLVMLNELRTLGGNDLNKIVPELIASMPKDHPDTVSLFRWVLQRLEVFGKEAVQWWCLYLAHGRVGMSSSELADLLSRKLGSDAAATALRIERGLRHYLQRRGPQLDFFHGQLRQAVFKQYSSQVLATTVHKELADCFTTCAKGTNPKKEWETDSVRGFAECVFHLTKAGQHEQAAELLSNFPFLLHKLRVGLLEGVFEDYGLFRREGSVEQTKTLEIWSSFFSEKAHILRRGNKEWPAHKILLQLAIEHADDSPLTIGAEQWLAEEHCDWFWLRRVPRSSHVQKNPCLAVLEGHTDEVNGALVLANGRLLSWGEDSTLRLWDGISGKCLAVLEGHTAGIRGSLALADGRLLSWSNDNTLRLWDGRSGKCLKTFEGHSSIVVGALVLADSRILSWSQDWTLRLWDSWSGRCLSVLEGSDHDVNGVLILTDGRFLSWDSTILRIWDNRSATCLITLKGHTGWIEGARELPDGKLLSWSQDGTLRIWDSRSGDCLEILKGHTDIVEGALLLEHGRILSWSWDKMLRLWNTQSATCLTKFEGHTDRVNGAFTLDDGRLVSWSGDHTLRVWDIQSGNCIIILEGHTKFVRGALKLHDERLLSWSNDKTLRMWNAKHNVCLATFEGHADTVDGVRVLSDERLLSWSHDRTLRIWNSHNCASITAIEKHHDVINGVLPLTDNRILSWSDDKTLRVWDNRTGICLTTLVGHIGIVRGALQLVDGQILSWSHDNTLRVWDSQSGGCLATLIGHTDSINGSLELENQQLVSWSIDQTLRIWDAQYGVCLLTLKGHIGSVWGVLNMPDGGVVSWSSDQTIRLWDTQNGVCRATLLGHTGTGLNVMALPKGRLLSWGGWASGDKDARLWDYQRGTCLAILVGHVFSVNGMLALTDGRLLSWSSDHTLRLWDSLSASCVGILQGHTSSVDGALELSDSQLISWSTDKFTGGKTLRSWNSQSGALLEVISEDKVARKHPEWCLARRASQSPASVVHMFFLTSSTCTGQLFHKAFYDVVASWNADSYADASCLLPDGTAVVTLKSGQICFLKLYHGRLRVSLDELEELLKSNIANKQSQMK